MKNSRIIISIFFSLTILFSCKSDPQTASGIKKEIENKPSSAAGDVSNLDALDHDFAITSAGSKLFLKGFFNKSLINSAITIDNGKLHIQKGLITTGEFNLNIGSIVVVGKRDEVLDKSLASEKNFNASKFPTGTIRITECLKALNDQQATHIIKGDLTIKGKTVPFNVRARIDYSPKSISINSDQIIVKASEISIKVADPSQENLYFTLTVNATIP